MEILKTKNAAPSLVLCEGSGVSTGYSIIELCTVVFITGLIFCFGVTMFNRFLMHQEKEIVLDRLSIAIEYAKQQAFIRGKIITLCPSIDYKTCKDGHHRYKDWKDWTSGFIIIENNTHKKNNSNSNIVLKVFPKLEYGTLQFLQFGQYLNIYPNGMTHNNGTFLYCPHEQDRREIDGLIINNTTRTYRPTKHPVLGISLKKGDTPLATPFLCW